MAKWFMSGPITAAQLAEILGLHARWLRGEADGQRANLQGANLQGANLRDANLGSMQAIQIGPIGSRCDTLTILWGLDHERQPVDRVVTGCFDKSLADFEQAVEREHGQDFHGAHYRAAIAIAKLMRTVG